MGAGQVDGVARQCATAEYAAIAAPTVVSEPITQLAPMRASSTGREGASMRMPMTGYRTSAQRNTAIMAAVRHARRRLAAARATAGQIRLFSRDGSLASGGQLGGRKGLTVMPAIVGELEKALPEKSDHCSISMPLATIQASIPRSRSESIAREL